MGERWALLVVRELLLGPKRFTDLQDGLPGAGSAQRLTRARPNPFAGISFRIPSTEHGYAGDQVPAYRPRARLVPR
ncbi:MAG TPA: winged helix-turn-helix transcriptional regulator [Jatrophihabitans sp.]|nr:winged helix-turn-helix transcriptional regulator [Jatrophihabitans sp.]